MKKALPPMSHPAVEDFPLVLYEIIKKGHTERFSGRVSEKKKERMARIR